MFPGSQGRCQVRERERKEQRRWWLANQPNSQAKNITVGTLQSIVHTGVIRSLFRKEVVTYEDSIDREPSLLSALNQPLPVHLLLESFVRTLFLHTTSHLVSHNSHPLDLATRLCTQPVRKAAAEGNDKQGMLLNKVIHYRIVQSNWPVESGWRPLQNNIIYILLFCDTLQL